jgi:hypothetical protein
MGTDIRHRGQQQGGRVLARVGEGGRASWAQPGDERSAAAAMGVQNASTNHPFISLKSMGSRERAQTERDEAERFRGEA